MQKRSSIAADKRRSREVRETPGPHHYGIIDPHQLQPLHLKEYFKACLSENPEQAVRAQMVKNSDIIQRAQDYLHYREIQRIIALKEPELRVEKLGRYYLDGIHRHEAKKGIIGSGDVGGRYLVPLFDQPKHRNLRLEIMTMWGDMRYRGAVDTLVDLLKKHDKYWAAEKPGIPTESWKREERQRVHSEISYAVYNLGRIGDSRAREAIELTKRRWEKIDAEQFGLQHSQIVETCEGALRQLSAER